jgi:integrase/recombinase XerC
VPKLGEPSPVKGRTFEKEVYTAAEIADLMAVTSSPAPTAVRNRALIATLWQTGIRMNEALMLQPHDFDPITGEVFVRFGKGGPQGGPKNRRVRAGPLAVAEIQRWMAVRSGLDLPAGSPLFCTLHGTKMYSNSFRGALIRLAKKAGWTKRVHPHGFRHTFAVNLARANVSPALIQRQLGHKSLATTTIYMAGISTEDIAEAMEKVDWT